MTRELRQTDVSNTPELLRLAEEVQRTQEPRILVSQAQVLAVVVPISRAFRDRSGQAARRSRYPSVDQLRGLAGKLPTARTWSEVEQIAAEDHAQEAVKEGL